MPFAKVSNSIHKFDPMYVTDLTPDMMDGRIFKHWAGSLWFLILIMTLMSSRLDHTGGTFWKIGTGELSLELMVSDHMCSFLYFF